MRPSSATSWRGLIGAAIAWAAVSIIAVAGLSFLAPPVIEAIAMASNLLPVTLVEIETQWLQQLLAPINSVAAAIAMGALGIRKFYRRIFR